MRQMAAWLWQTWYNSIPSGVCGGTTCSRNLMYLSQDELLAATRQLHDTLLRAICLSGEIEDNSDSRVRPQEMHCCRMNSTDKVPRRGAEKDWRWPPLAGDSSVTVFIFCLPYLANRSQFITNTTWLSPPDYHLCGFHDMSFSEISYRRSPKSQYRFLRIS